MHLPGDLRRTTLGDLLGSLYRDEASGILELENAQGAHRLYLDRGLLRQVETPCSVPRLGELLAHKGFMTEKHKQRLAECLSVHPGQRVGQVLVEQGVVDERVIQAALRLQMKYRLERLFEIENARLRFRVPRPRTGDKDPRVPLSAAEFLYGRKRARDSRCSSGAGYVKQDHHRAQVLRMLGLSADAEEVEVRKAFRRMAARLHPDRHPFATNAQRAILVQRFAELSAAYHQLVA